MKIVGERTVWTVAEVSDACRRRFQDIRAVWIEAEVSNLRVTRNHVYFTLTDSAADVVWQVRCSMNADRFGMLDAAPRDGMHVQAYGRIEYNPRTVTLTFRVEQMAPAGEGLLRARIEELRRHLVEEGLTAPDRKQPIPMLPRAVGLVTSAGSAAEADIRRNIEVRHPGMSMVVVHSLMQGDAAPGQVVRALRHLDARDDVDVIVLARGGGPLEDLMAFNSEIVCRAVAAARTPVVSAIGHESDATLCDLVADLRVSTPTKAAEAVTPERDRLLADLEATRRRMISVVRGRGRSAREGLDARERRLVRSLAARGETAGARLAGLQARLRPSLTRRLEISRTALTSETRRLRAGITADLGHRAARAQGLAASLGGPGAALVRRRALDARAAHATLTHRLRVAMDGAGARRRTDLDHLAEVLGLLSPARTVARGYAIVRDARTGAVRTRRETIHDDATLDLEMRDGTVRVRVGAEGAP